MAALPEAIVLSDRPPTVWSFGLAAGKPRGRRRLGEPNGLALSADSQRLYVAQRKAHAIAVIDTAAGKVIRQIPVGLWPVGVTLSESTGRLYTCNRGDDSVSVVDLKAGEEIKRIPLVREPFCAAVTPDGSRVIVGNFLPHGAGTDSSLASVMSILDANRLEPTATIKLPPGASVVTSVSASPCGKGPLWLLLAVHVPITQWNAVGCYLCVEHHRHQGAKTLSTVLLERSTTEQPTMGRGRFAEENAWIIMRLPRGRILDIGKVHPCSKVSCRPS